MADDQTNPYTTLGMLSMLTPNPYTQYKGQLPMPGYRGTATDAQGKPIQSYTDAQTAYNAWNAANQTPAQGTTLNSTPQTISSADQWKALNSMVPSGSNSFTAGAGTPAGAWSTTGTGGTSGTSGTSGTAQSTATNPVDMRQAYLDALANPGKVTTPGATMQASQPLGTPNVLDAFLANHPSGSATSTGSGYSNKPFFDTLSQLRSTG